MTPFLENRLLSLKLYFMCLEYISLKNTVALSEFIYIIWVDLFYIIRVKLFLWNYEEIQ